MTWRMWDTPRGTPVPTWTMAPWSMARATATRPTRAPPFTILIPQRTDTPRLTILMGPIGATRPPTTTLSPGLRLLRWALRAQLSGHQCGTTGTTITTGTVEAGGATEVIIIIISTIFITTSFGTAPDTGQGPGGLVTGTQVMGGLVWVRGRVWDAPVWRRFRPEPTSTTARGFRISSPAVTLWQDPDWAPVEDRKQDQGVNPSR